MAVPTFLAGVLNTDFNYLSRTAITDTITILNDLNTQLTALGWTCSVAGSSPTAVGTYQSPTTVAGIFIKVVITQVSATVLKFACTDYWGIAINTTANTPQQNIVATGGGTEARYYCNKYGFFLDTLPSGVAECFACGILDQTPEAINVPRASCFCSTGPRNSANTLAGNACDNYWLLLVGAATYTSSTSYAGCMRMTCTNVAIVRSTIAGSLLVSPQEFAGSATPYWFYGRVFQALLVDSGQAFGAQITVPIDTGMTAVFRVLGFITGTYGNVRLAARIS